uniref:Uncharacterized protein n=1 Tax=Opuntia streptacantha TaxID=393608 RepID=A0A7C9AC72_OPUST
MSLTLRRFGLDGKSTCPKVVQEKGNGLATKLLEAISLKAKSSIPTIHLKSASTSTSRAIYFSFKKAMSLCRHPMYAGRDMRVSSRGLTTWRRNLFVLRKRSFS